MWKSSGIRQIINTSKRNIAYVKTLDFFSPEVVMSVKFQPSYLRENQNDQNMREMFHQQTQQNRGSLIFILKQDNMNNEYFVLEYSKLEKILSYSPILKKDNTFQIKYEKTIQKGDIEVQSQLQITKPRNQMNVLFEFTQMNRKCEYQMDQEDYHLLHDFIKVNLIQTVDGLTLHIWMASQLEDLALNQQMIIYQEGQSFHVLNDLNHLYILHIRHPM